MNAVNEKYSVVIGSKRTSVSLEPEFYAEVKRIAADRHQTISEFVSDIAAEHSGTHSLSGDLRLAVLRDLRARAFPQAPATAPELHQEGTVS